MQQKQRIRSARKPQTDAFARHQCGQFISQRTHIKRGELTQISKPSQTHCFSSVSRGRAILPIFANIPSSNRFANTARRTRSGIRLRILETSFCNCLFAISLKCGSLHARTDQTTPVIRLRCRRSSARLNQNRSGRAAERHIIRIFSIDFVLRGVRQIAPLGNGRAEKTVFTNLARQFGRSFRAEKFVTRFFDLVGQLPVLLIDRRLKVDSFGQCCRLLVIRVGGLRFPVIRIGLLGFCLLFADVAPRLN